MAMFYFWVVVLIVLEFGISFHGKQKAFKSVSIPICNKNTIVAQLRRDQTSMVFLSKIL